MKKLALSVVALMVAGAGMSVSAVGCSSSSSAGATEDSGTGEDVTTGDSGEVSETSTGDSATPADSGTGEAAATCDVDAAGSIQIGTDTDAGFVENTACEACIAANCAVPQCQCLTDTTTVTVDDAGEPACGAYAGCVYPTFLMNLATSDAGAAGLGTDLMNAQASCAGSFSMGSIGLGNALIGCIASSCAAASAGCLP
jgi:hypothetical protein